MRLGTGLRCFGVHGSLEVSMCAMFFLVPCVSRTSGRLQHAEQRGL